MRLEGMFSRRFPAALAVLGACAAFAAALAIAVPRASAVETFPTGAVTMLTDHFAIVYASNPGDAAYITQPQVANIAGWAERAYALYTSWGYPAPPTVGGRTVINVISFDALGPPWTLFDADAVPTDPAAGVTSGVIRLDNKRGVNLHEVAHVVFNVFEFGVWQPTDLWLKQAAAEWAAYRVEDFVTPTQSSLGQSDVTGDCVGGDCGTVNYDRAGDPGWTFMEYLSERYGADIVKQLFTYGASVGLPAPAATQYVADVLTSKGSSFESVFTDYTVARLTGNFSISSIKGLLPIAQVTASLGTASGAIPTQKVSVSHFATRYVALRHGDGSTGPCYAATLALNVAIPSGINAKPYFYANTVGASAQALSISGSNASITVPWNTCTGSADAYLALPNPSTSVAANGKEFTVSGTLSVDMSAPASATPPPAPLFTGATVAAPTTSAAPSIFVYGAQVVRVSAVNRVVRLIVFSSGPGLLRAAVGQTVLGTEELRAGNNDVRFRLPPSAVAAMRKALGVRATTSVLTLTSLSTLGATGTKLARKLVVFTPPTPARRSA